MKTLFSKDQRRRLVANGKAQMKAVENNGWIDQDPIVELSIKRAGVRCLLTHVRPDDPDMAYGLVDLGSGQPTLTEVSLGWLTEFAGLLGLQVYNNPNFRVIGSLSLYYVWAKRAGRIAT